MVWCPWAARCQAHSTHWIVPSYSSASGRAQVRSTDGHLALGIERIRKPVPGDPTAEGTSDQSQQLRKDAAEASSPTHSLPSAAELKRCIEGKIPPLPQGLVMALVPGGQTEQPAPGSRNGVALTWTGILGATGGG